MIETRLVIWSFVFVSGCLAGLQLNFSHDALAGISATVTCTLNNSEHSNMATLFSLVITKSDVDVTSSSSNFAYLGSMDIYTGLNLRTWKATGSLNENATSYVTLDLGKYRPGLAGVYRCQAYGETRDGTEVTLTKTTNVKTPEPDTEELFVSLLSQRERFWKIDHELRMLEGDFLRMSGCCQIFEQSLSTNYNGSTAFNGSKYYLSRPTGVSFVKEAEIQCELRGGYLAEVDSRDEMSFIKSFVRGYDTSRGVYIGGCDEKEEGAWVNTYSKTIVNYLEWAEHVPGHDRTKNCMALSRDFDWRMEDVVCAHGETAYMSYLCEVKV